VKFLDEQWNGDMEKQKYNAMREGLTAEYTSNMQKSEMRLDELHTKSRNIEDCYDEIQSFYVESKSTLNHHQSVLVQHGSHEDLGLLSAIEDELNNDCHSAENALLDEKEEIERERKQIFKDREDTEYEYQRAMSNLNESE